MSWKQPPFCLLIYLFRNYWGVKLLVFEFLVIHTSCYSYFSILVNAYMIFLVIVAMDVWVLSCFPMNLHYGSRYSHSCLKFFPLTQLFSWLTNHYFQLSSNSYVTYLYICLKIATYHLPSKSHDIKLQQLSTA